MTEARMLEDLLRARHSCRAFRPDQLDDTLIREALLSARHVPSWCNAQPWSVTVCSAGETDKLRAALHSHAQTGQHASDIPFPERYEGPYQARRRVCGWQLYDAVGVEKGDRAGSARQMMENFRLFGAPRFALITTPKALGPYGVLDCGAFVTAFLLALQARGVASCAMASVAGFSPFMRGWFDVPEDRNLLCGVAMGYADAGHPANAFRTERAPLEEFVDWR